MGKTDLEFQFESLFNFDIQPKCGIQLGIPILILINLGECVELTHIDHVEMLQVLTQNNDY